MKLIEADKVKQVMKDYWKAQVDKALALIDGNEANKRINSYLEHNHELLKAIDELPTVQPETNCSEIPNNWIPCSDRMPEEHEWIGTKRFGTTISDEVYVTFEAPDGQRFADHISFQNGKLSRSDEQRMKVLYKGAKPIAWKPQPEPYQEGDGK